MNQISIAHIGLSEKDQLLIRNLCRLSKSVMGQFSLQEKSNCPQGELLIIDADSYDAENQFKLLQRFKQFSTVIAITQQDGDLPRWVENAHPLKRPLVLRKVSEIFENQLSNHLESTEKSGTNPILVVDDALPVRTFMKQRLHDLLGDNVAVDLACNGEQALKMARENDYRLIFLDVMMPDIDGYQVCRELRAKRKTPIVMLTSKSSAINKVKAKMSGSNGYITKPPSDTELLAEITRFIPGIEHAVSTNLSQII